MKLTPSDADARTVRAGHAVEYQAVEEPPRAMLAARPVTLSPILLPCRVCLAAPGTSCSDVPANDFHPMRASDTELATELIRDRTVRPSVLRRESVRP